MPSPGIKRELLSNNSRGTSATSWKCAWASSPRLEQVEVFELAESRPEMEEVHHRMHVGMCRFADHFECRRQRGQVSRGPSELDHRGQVVLFGDLSRFANASRRGFVVVRRDFPVGDGSGTNPSAGQERKTDRSVASISREMQCARGPESRDGGAPPDLRPPSGRDPCRFAPRRQGCRS